MMKSNERFPRRVHRHARIRTRVHGNAVRPRLAVFRSSKHISAQLIDDERGTTLAAASNWDLKERGLANVDRARAVGRLIAERAKNRKITKAVFDRGGHAYHGQVQALAEGAREGGLEV